MNKFKTTLSYISIAIAVTFQSCTSEQDPGVGFTESPGEVNEDISTTSNEIAHEWTDLLLDLERYSQGRPNASARGLAYIYLAAYETVVPGMPGYLSTDDQFRRLRIRDDEKAEEISYRIALNSCFAKVVDHFLINVPENLTSAINTLETQIEGSISSGLTEDIINDSREWGEYVADRVIAFSETDDDAETQILEPQPDSYEPPTGEGFWTYSAEEERALFPYWGESVRTFVIAPDETTTVPPIEYSEAQSSEYYAQMLEVVNENNRARAEDGEDLWIAEFWSDDVEGLMFSPPARQFSIANQLIDQYGLNLEQTLVLYVKLGFSLNDAAVAAWKYKYDYMVMRPNVYIHEFIDADFQTNLYRLVYWPNPSFPSYPSGHSTFASAAAGLFIDAFGNQTDFTDRSHEGRTEFRGAPRNFNTFQELARENAFSRIPLGVHMSMDCEEGLRLGYEISNAVSNWSLTSTGL